MEYHKSIGIILEHQFFLHPWKMVGILWKWFLMRLVENGKLKILIEMIVKFMNEASWFQECPDFLCNTS